MIFLLQAKCKGPLKTLVLSQEDAAALPCQVHTAGAQGMSYLWLLPLRVTYVNLYPRQMRPK